MCAKENGVFADLMRKLLFINNILKKNWRGMAIAGLKHMQGNFNVHKFM